MSRPHGIAFLAANPISPPHGWHPSRSSCVTCHRLNNAGRSPRTTWLPLNSFLPKTLSELLAEEALFRHQTEPKKLVQRSYHSLPNEQRITYRESILCPCHDVWVPASARTTKRDLSSCHPPPPDQKKGPFWVSPPPPPRVFLFNTPEPFSVRRGVLLRGAFPECFCRGRESIPSSRRCTTRCLLSSASQRRA